MLTTKTVMEESHTQADSKMSLAGKCGSEAKHIGLLHPHQDRKTKQGTNEVSYFQSNVWTLFRCMDDFIINYKMMH